MKIKATFEEIKNRREFVVGVGYCELQKTLIALGYEVDLYNAAHNGWVCDFYPITPKIGVVTGYDYNKACDVTAYNLVPLFAQKLREIEQKANKINYDDVGKAELKAEFENLLEQAANGVYTRGEYAYIKIEQCVDLPSAGKYKERFLIVENKKIKMRSTLELMSYCEKYAKKYAEKHNLFYDWKLLNIEIFDDEGNFIYTKLPKI